MANAGLKQGMRYRVFQLMLALLIGVTQIGCSQKLTTEKKASVTQTKKKIPYGKVTKYGLFRERGKGWAQPNAKSSTGKVIRGATLEFTGSDTQKIPLRKGVSFGYRYWLKIPPEQTRPQFRRVLIHPEITLPDGTKVTRSERIIKKRAAYGVVTSIDAYALSEDYELKKGEWIFQLWHEGKMLTEQKFFTYWAN